MAVIKETSGKKFSKSRTNIDVPSIARASQVAQGLSLTSSADIDTNNNENLYFHIMGALPSQIILFIYGEKFNQNFYTEIGAHNHGPGNLATGNVASGTTSHGHPGSYVSLGSHGHPGSSLSFAGTHRHAVYTGYDGGWKIDIDGGSSGTNGYRYYFPIDNTSTPILLTDGSHIHTVTIATTNLGSPGATIATASVDAHGHLVTTGITATVGLLPFSGAVHASGSARSYFNAMKIAIDGVDKTSQLLTQAALAAFGDGTAGHVLVTTGVQLDLLPFISTPGQHKVTFSLNTGSPNNGGKIRYNLYTVA